MSAGVVCELLRIFAIDPIRERAKLITKSSLNFDLFLKTGKK
jgi:hypothetical protein